MNVSATSTRASECLLLSDFPFGVGGWLVGWSVDKGCVVLCYVCDASLSVLCQWRVYDTNTPTHDDADGDVFACDVADVAARSAGAMLVVFFLSLSI